MAAFDGMPLLHRQQQFMAILRQRRSGSSSAEMAAAAKVSRRHAQHILATLHQLGMAEFARSGKKVAWSTSEHSAYVRRLISGRRRARVLDRERRLAKERQQEAEAREWLRIKRRVVPAGRFPPPECIAANSVFNLAQRA